MRKKLYLANPYGFSKQTKTLLHEFIEIFNDLNVEVYEPFERAKPLTQQKSQWIVFPWENTLNSKSDSEEYIKKRGLS